MQLGIFAKTFARPSFAQALDAVAAHGLRCIHFNFTCVGLPTMPEHIGSEVIASVQEACAGGTSSASPHSTVQSGTHGTRPSIGIAGVSGTFNMIDPDVANRRGKMARLPVLARATRELGCNLITLCTGTRDPEDMWRAHRDNASPGAWHDLLSGMEQAIAVAEEHDILLGVEPETGNVVSSARQARRLLDELHSPRVKIVIDPANLFHAGHVERIRETMEEAFQLLGTDIVMAHAKELPANGASGSLAPGRGVIDWDYYFGVLARMDFRGTMILHGLAEADVVQGVRFLRSKFCD